MKPFSSLRFFGVGVIAGLSLISSAFGAAYIKFDGIAGESTHGGRTGWIELQTFSHDVMNTQSRTSGGGARQASFSDLQVAKHIDKSTPKLMEACVSGKRIPRVVLEVVSSDPEKPQRYLSYTLQDVLVSSYSAIGTDDVPTENLSLNFTKIEWTHTTHDDAGNPVETQGSWELKPAR